MRVIDCSKKLNMGCLWEEGWYRKGSREARIEASRLTATVLVVDEGNRAGAGNVR
ncbi:MAG: hypothetical protein ACLP51_06950 [Syntrophobacteraceae bacterium]